jgi:hypothetical protein
MNTFNLTQVVDFPTRIINNNGTVIDTIFVDTKIYDKIQVKPFIYGLSDHGAQIICLQNANIGLLQSVSKIKPRLINERTIKHFLTLLKDETWHTVYKSACTNEMYSRFQGIFLRYYDAGFPVFHKIIGQIITTGSQKVSKYHVPRKESSILYIEIIKTIFK